MDKCIEFYRGITVFNENSKVFTGLFITEYYKKKTLKIGNRNFVNIPVYSAFLLFFFMTDYYYDSYEECWKKKKMTILDAPRPDDFVQKPQARASRRRPAGEKLNGAWK